MTRMNVRLALVLLVLAIILGGSLPRAWAEGNPVSQVDLQTFYRPLFEDPYTEMFETDSTEGVLKINGHELGRFMAGPRGIVFYLGLNGCAAKFLKEKAGTDFYDLSALERLSGLKMLSQPFDENRTDAFRRYNPLWVRWARHNLIPWPKDEVYGHSFRVLYQKVFSRFFRLMAESYVFLQTRLELGREQQEYLKAASVKGFEALGYLEKKFGGALDAYHVDRNHSWFTPDMAIGFWIRRAADGSATEFWEGLQAVMLAYDRPWFEKLVQDLPAASPKN